MDIETIKIIRKEIRMLIPVIEGINKTLASSLPSSYLQACLNAAKKELELAKDKLSAIIMDREDTNEEKKENG